MARWSALRRAKSSAVGGLSGPKAEGGVGLLVVVGTGPVVDAGASIALDRKVGGAAQRAVAGDDIDILVDDLLELGGTAGCKVGGDHAQWRHGASGRGWRLARHWRCQPVLEMADRSRGGEDVDGLTMLENALRGQGHHRAGDGAGDGEDDQCGEGETSRRGVEESGAVMPGKVE